MVKPPTLVPLPSGGFMGTAQTLRRPPSPPKPAPPSPKHRGDAPRPQTPAPSPVVFVRPAPAPPPPPPPRPLSTRERVALALLDAADEIGKPVPWVVVVLVCWRRWPSAFGLRGHPEHPDSNRVLARLSSCAAEGYATSDGRGGWTPTRAALALHATLRAREALP